MSTAIHIENCLNVKISNCSVSGFSKGIHAINSSKVICDNLRTEDCEKGVVLDNCWDSEVSNFNYNSVGYMGFRLRKLSVLINNFMYNN